MRGLMIFSVGVLWVHLASGCFEFEGFETPCDRLACNDGNPCTSDSCTWGFETTCHNYAVDVGTPCGGGRVCVGKVCRENLCADVDCNDGDLCSEDRCDYYDGSCVQSLAQPNGTPCGGDEVCVSGFCSENLCADCEDDGNDCTIDCDYETGVCEYVRRPDESICRGDQHEGVCMSNACIVCDELDCDDHDVCTNDWCNPEYGGCYHNRAIYCGDNNDCTMDICDPVSGECSNPADDGHWCYAESGSQAAIGVCDGDKCTGQPCDVAYTESYPCPVPLSYPISTPRVCCPLSSYHPHQPYCITEDACRRRIWEPLCAEICPDNATFRQRTSYCVAVEGDCELVDLCVAECRHDVWKCVNNDGVCPSP